MCGSKELSREQLCPGADSPAPYLKRYQPSSSCHYHPDALRLARQASMTDYSAGPTRRQMTWLITMVLVFGERCPRDCRPRQRKRSELQRDQPYHDRADGIAARASPTIWELR